MNTFEKSEQYELGTTLIGESTRRSQKKGHGGKKSTLKY